MAVGCPEPILSRMVPVYFPGILAGYQFPITLKCPTLWTPTLLVSSRERPDRQVSVADSKTRALCYPRLPLKNYKFEKEG